MPNKKSLIDDTAYVCTISIMEEILPALCGEDAPSVSGAVYERVQAALEAFVIQSSREAQRLQPSRN